MPPKPKLPTLPLHLMMTMGTWLTSPFGLQCANAGLPRSKLAPNRLQKAVAKEAQNRAADLLKGVLHYMETPYARKVPEPAAIWQRGNTRLLDYGAGRGTWDVERGNSTATRHVPPATITLFIPSLINRYYILDLEENRSMLRFMAGSGVHPLVLDWGEPGKFEAGFGCGEYITEILLPAIEFVSKTAGQPIALAGYCMGGLLALAATQLKPKYVSKLALLATPWNFHCKEFAPFVLEKEWQQSLASVIAGQKSLPAEIIQSLFYMTDPFVFEQKFRRFAAMDTNSRDAMDFVALEHWVNDGVAMTSKVAHDCLIGWAQHNSVARGEWRVAGKIIDPKKIKCPAFIAIPKSDHVVPLDCAQPLASLMPHAKTIRPPAGHVGMIVGHQARKELWQKLVDWLGAN